MEDLIKQLKGPIAVIGGNGFIGGHLHRKIRSVRSDVENITREAMRVVRPGYFNTAFNLSGNSRGSLDEMLHDNVLSVDKWLAGMSPSQTFIHAGSSAEYNDGSSLYSITKRTASDLVQYYGETVGIPCCTLILFTVYGEGEPNGRLLPTMRKHGLHAGLPLLGDPKAVYDFVHVDDVCRAFILAATNLMADDYGTTFDIGTGRKTSLTQVVDIARKSFNLGAITERWGQIRTTSGYEYIYTDTESTRECLGFSAEIMPEEGIKKYFSETI